MNYDVKKLSDDFERKVDFYKKQKGNELIRTGKIQRIQENQYAGEEIEVNSIVFSQEDYSYYHVDVFIDCKTSKINGTNCDCLDFYKNGTFKDIYICKHIAAVLSKYIDLKIVKEKETKNKIENMGQYILDELINLNKPKEKINLVVNLSHKNFRGYYQVDFKIGNKKMYVLKNIKDFIKAKYENEGLTYGKDFTYFPNEHIFNEIDESIVEYIEEALAIDNLYGYNNGLIDGKYINIKDTSLRRFLEMIKEKGITYDLQKVKIIQEDVPIKIDINEKNEKYIISMFGDSLKALTSKYDVFLFGGNIYLPSKSQMKSFEIFYKYFEEFKRLEFRKEKALEMFNTVMPKLENISSHIKIDSKIDNLVKSDLKAEFFLDIRKKGVVLDINLKYGEETLKYFNSTDKKEKIIIRDTNKEEKILDILTNLNFTYENNIFIFNGDEYALYLFLSEKYKELETLGDVYYSDRFRERKVYSTPRIEANIKDREDGFLDFTFNIDEISSKEYKSILDAFKNKRKYYKLKDDSFINLEGEEIQDFLALVDEIAGTSKDGSVKLHKNKAIVLNDYLENNNLSCVKGKNIVENISNKVLDLNNLNYILPSNLKTELRDYQIIGFKWFKNLSYLGLGGVLADEMGLGKTVQTISFLLSEEGKKSLIVTPTSLVYNWKNEFSKFAPSLRVGIIHGNKNEREKNIENMDEYDVILTTYGTLRNDEENYKKLKFDYCILDEGQNIKNPLAQSTKSVKNIKAKTKFVLTGTPIENNLIELWSIFDFIMPNYLYNTTTFKKRFINNHDTTIELQKYIKPFMLRRLKKDVITELPDKIEKNYYVELSKEQKKVYGAYVNNIKEKMEDENFQGDKITIFSYLTKLRQLCLDPSIIMENYKGRSAKMEEAINIIKENIENGHKILLFSQFTSVLGNISSELSNNGIEHMYLDGSTKANKRLELVDEFNNSDNCKVFLISLKAGGTGLNLTSADIIIHFDPWWNPAVEEQATDRAHRIGQKNVVQVFKLISEGTIEERIINMQEDKKALINDVLDSDYKSENILSSLSKEELMELFA
ncbi:DEAD/DEAH box helicase [Clostridium sp. SHJSY1]|uniref:DEAD/DEAH box helicase n=1 Tax=Clostridium sp. SHJSY1 TaxID=2942483 RepID=UPI0028759D21|nr:DEAD/DEAH box helicase [Clostridium sp. SHJSY1]MDS0527764.1 DEAD/DEAH box helicase [Clostridium sp. SHJSY1]